MQPKAIVHRAGGMLLQSKKEHLIHGGLGPDDIYFFVRCASLTTLSVDLTARAVHESR